MMLSLSVLLVLLGVLTAVPGTRGQCNETGLDPARTDVVNMITKAPQDDIWIEGGFLRAGDQEWVTVSTILDSFIDAAVFVSLPDIAGDTSNEGYPAIARVRNVVSTGQVTFDVKLFQANDSACSKEWTIPQPIVPLLSLSWLAVERGAFNLSGNVFMIGDGSITRATSAPYNSANRHTYSFPAGCEVAGKPCEYEAGVDVGIIMQLQTTVNERLLILRVYSSSGITRNNSVTLVLQTHDSADSSYYTVSAAEQLAFMTYVNNIDVSCVERLSFETTKYDPVTNTKLDIDFIHSYALPPGIYGTIATARSLGDSTGLRAFARTVTGASFITQEDQCLDEETDHINGELVYTFVVGERSNSSCTVCKAVFSPDTVSPTSLPTANPTLPRPTSLPSDTPTLNPSTPAPTTTCTDAIEVVRMRRDI